MVNQIKVVTHNIIIIIEAKHDTEAIKTKHCSKQACLQIIILLNKTTTEKGRPYDMRQLQGV